MDRKRDDLQRLDQRDQCVVELEVKTVACGEEELLHRIHKVGVLDALRIVHLVWVQHNSAFLDIQIIVNFSLIQSFT